MLYNKLVVYTFFGTTFIRSDILRIVVLPYISKDLFLNRKGVLLILVLFYLTHILSGNSYALFDTGLHLYFYLFNPQ